MSEQLPHFNLSVDNKDTGPYEFEANPTNTELFRHLGSLALSVYDHVYIDMSTEEENRCMRLWRHHPNYEQLEGFMIAKKFPIHDNLRTVNKYDLDSYDEMIKRETEMDSIPDNWLDELK